MNLKEIKDLIRAISASNLTEFKFQKEGLKISMKTDKCGHVITQTAPQMVQAAPMAVTPTHAAPATSAPAEVPAAADSGDDSNLLEIKSPIVGTFYRSSSPDKDAYVQVGDNVNVGSVVCIVEAMKLFNEIESEVAGKIVKVMVDDSTPIEYDQVLFLVDPNA